VATDVILRSAASCALSEIEKVGECREAGGVASLAVTAIVDDDPGVRKSLARLLSALGYRTEAFESAGEFLLAARTGKRACVLIDINLGDTSGLDLVRELSMSGFRSPVIFITGVEDEMIQRRAIELGCIAFLRKPIPADQLVEAVKKATGSAIRKLAVILHRMWIDGTEFNWSSKEATNQSA
jgi:FixJ family two-component response regulator